jgi:hypothetical protein
MVIRTRIGKVAGVALAAGVLAIAGLGVGTASADNGGTPGGATPGGATPGAQQMRPDGRPGPRPGQNGPAQQDARVQPGAPGQLQGGPGVPNGLQQGPRPGQAAPNAANNQEAVRARGVIAAAAEVMAVQPESVLSGLEQGQTLTVVAASHGLSRDYFLSELVAQIEKDIKDGQRFGIPASANLNVQLASMVDQQSLGLRGAALSNLF